MSIEKQIKEATDILNNISEDQTVPRNIRRAATQSLSTLADKEMEVHVRAVNAIELLEDILGDPNCPYHARTLIWHVITRLELPTNLDDDDDDEYEDDDDDDFYEEEEVEWVEEEEEESKEDKEGDKKKVEKEDDWEPEWSDDFDSEWGNNDDDDAFDDDD